MEISDPEYNVACCDICGELADLKEDRDPCTNNLRGKLCPPCVQGLASFDRDGWILLEAADYLKDSHNISNAIKWKTQKYRGLPTLGIRGSVVPK